MGIPISVLSLCVHHLPAICGHRGSNRQSDQSSGGPKQNHTGGRGENAVFILLAWVRSIVSLSSPEANARSYSETNQRVVRTMALTLNRHRNYGSTRQSLFAAFDANDQDVIGNAARRP